MLWGCHLTHAADQCIYLHRCLQAICVTGSKHDAYAKEEWNFKLQELLRTAFDRQQRILGICFGCQTMAIVLGGRVGDWLFQLFCI